MDMDRGWLVVYIVPLGEFKVVVHVQVTPSKSTSST